MHASRSMALCIPKALPRYPSGSMPVRVDPLTKPSFFEQARRWVAALLADVRGVTAVEFALVAPMLMVAVMGAADFGFAANEKMRLVSAARAGAQAGFGNPGSASSMIAAATAATGLNPAAVTVTTANTCGCADGSTIACSSVCQDGSVLRSYVTVTVSEVYSLLLTYPGFPNPLTFSASSTLRVG